MAASASLAASASAATSLGQTFDPFLPSGDDSFGVQAVSPGGQYTLPSDGVITSWSFQAGPNPTMLRLKVAGLSPLTVTGQSDMETAPANATTGFPTRIPADAGEVIGLYFPVSQPGARNTAGHTLVGVSGIGDPPPGTTIPSPFSSNDIQLDVSAVLEPDNDNDGFGDETQDECPTSAASQDECVPPTATITKRPKDKTKKKKAKFEFTGSDARAVASFQCRVDDDSFQPCTSPHKVKVKKGKHKFEVRAVDDAGNVGSPASDTWKRKKKKKK